jgi:two-component system alkaline phosphatase synthesis response regulator PhoP
MDSIAAEAKAETILVVEDEETTRSLIQYKLKNSGYNVVSVSDGAQALEVLRTTKPSLIILDLMMPLMSGREFLITLRQRDAFKKLPVIILSAKTLEKDVLEGLSLGADDFMKKPFSPSELIARVRMLLSRRSPG